MTINELVDLLYQLKLADLNVTSLFKTQTGFNLTRYVILLFLKKNGTVTQGCIQRKLQIDNAAVTRHLKDLEEQGHVTRKRNPENNREVIVALTPATQDDLQHCGKTPEDKFLLALFGGQFTPQEISQLADLLQRLGRLNLS
ncbi:MarR family winged helix-turn-helix transcriptional regulator [Levilactobacillus acidifarinae]|uniref:HTH marR-type domain-containing protein n=1 Tax=Levilactobacillus acidifarinae DSM 19394 = JCM 15949 TaxID=1423715 RepID=A0A0R1LEU5_9LACO|nr:MarR family transcriptional regulator [Levilactobacillus acidifarinae]KRK94143.1 hypothetical protein FD25_GL000964 [Levilactobacillus acidifarinae DSM 19394]GEO70603.1 hypothetical protein LAC03_25130 [Levilactobacillus acidifarinae]